MASITVSASCPASTFGGAKLSKSTAGSAQRVMLSQQPKGGVVVRAQAVEAEAGEKKSSSSSSSSRRDVMFGAAAAAMFWSAVSAAGEANAAEGEPKKGSAEAKKLYAPVCVTMPTARICRN